MSKEKENNRMRINVNGSPIARVSESLNKHGKIKGANKKETKRLKSVCVHHKIGKKGKIKSTIENHNGEIYCTMCGKRFPSTLYSAEEVDRIVSDIEELNNQAKFMAVATGSGDDTVKYFASVGAYMEPYKKTYNKVKDIAQRKDAVKNKKKKHKNDRYDGSSSYGSWG